MNNLKISLILSTLGTRKNEFIRLIDSLVNQKYKNFEFIVVSQDNHNIINTILSNSPLTFLHIKSNLKGLSRGRNIALKKISGDLFCLTDDDCWYPDDALQRVNDFFCKHENIDVVSYQIFDPESNLYYKQYPLQPFKLNILNVTKCSSIELFIKNSNKINSISFDESFGLGAEYPGSEEIIFLADLLKIRCTIFYLPEIIVFHNIKNLASSKFNNKRMQTALHVFVRLYSRPWGIFLYYMFFLKYLRKVENKISSLFLKFP
ncbi:glycosyltransferase family 2 protein [Emticicia sp. C21]|uniref:glycosyltransferase family 2 protein n=1 Tax=Emticicia sp. C21 TaxID=2302915 RepID=UPI000E3463D8|nr:glycosyltransferase family 2 protein [Emticicia sp. C21]RFS17234.1 glycosyltransferase family 2 protein [Emticicia sp. C21]